MQCNIDARGKAARLRAGIVSVLLAGGLAIVAWLDLLGTSLAWWAAGALLAMGAFAIFEARAGWCVVRAMGFRTRL